MAVKQDGGAQGQEFLGPASTGLLKLLNLSAIHCTCQEHGAESVNVQGS